MAKYVVYSKNIIFNNSFFLSEGLTACDCYCMLDRCMLIIEHSNGLNSSIEYSITCIEFNIQEFKEIGKG